MVTRTVSVLRFGAGELSVAVSAECVAGIDDRDSGAPHIAAALGAISTAGANRQRRTVRVVVGGRSVEFVVDAPVEITEICPQDVRRLTGLEPQMCPDFLLGFARADGGLVALIDLPKLLVRLEAGTKHE